MSLPTEYDDELDYIRPKESSLVSIVIPAYNSASHIKKCLDSVVAQTYKNWEAIVVCAPSADNTVGELMQYHDERIHVYHEGTKSNVATARNGGIVISRGKYILFLDSDDWMEPKRIAWQVDYMERNKVSQWCWGFVRSVLPDGTISINNTDPTQVGGLVGILSLMFRKEGIIKFDETLPYFDDVDFFLKLRKLPHGCIPDVITNYYLNPHGLTQTSKVLESDAVLWKILINNCAWEYTAWKAKESFVLALRGCRLI